MDYHIKLHHSQLKNCNYPGIGYILIPNIHFFLYEQLIFINLLQSTLIMYQEHISQMGLCNVMVHINFLKIYFSNIILISLLKKFNNLLY